MWLLTIWARKMAAGISFFMVSSSDLKYKLVRYVTFKPLLFWIAPGLISCIFIWNLKKKSVWYNFYQGTSVSITFYIFEHYQLWMMDSKAQRVFFPKTPKLCVWHTEVRSCYHLKLVSHFQLWFPIWGALVNRLKPEMWSGSFYKTFFFFFVKTCIWTVNHAFYSHFTV